ncbi:MAG: hypothetical protein C0594_12525 [Marinilabiliales bacterium]|nr:MAG: hypothetical protein C0594_12525 [Marinilabiliales bacterium]
MVFDTFYVKASFHTNNKRIFHGFCTVSNHTFKFEIQPYKPTIIQGKKHIPFWFGRHQPEEETIVGYFMHLRINPENLFPVTVHIEPDIFHIEKEGKIPGFSGIDDKMKDIIISSP